MRYIFIGILFIFHHSASASALKIAVASNFAPVLKKIVRIYKKQNIKIITGSSGKLFSMIDNGAPFDIFLSADEKLPTKLVKDNKAFKDSHFTYATGKLVVWTRDKKNKNIEESFLSGLSIDKLALANPKHAPYGRAAMEVLDQLKLKDRYKNKLAIAENVSQAYSFVYSQNAQLGILPSSLVLGQDKSLWVIPREYYSPIRQDLVILKRTQLKKEAYEFIKFLQTSVVRELIYASGYLKIQDF